ncbi:protein cornichon homolog 4 [Cryptotermes secundus]|uniref:protein cornichon homolog 4 n=1 Tax=Cryptotermes secundus TaxID=105785 RepID=UPI000CD7B975|nr:protein cornichon homolog 4 [Cryptotermes secundus]XP_033609202.1 protein cornichon homolog 4 [Cryptotermes secundus]
MVPDPYLFTFSLIDTGAVLFLLVYFVITLSDLECDYLNAQQCCSKLNAWVLPKLAAHGFMTLLLLFHAHWILAVANLPLALWLSYEYFTVPRGNTGVFDPTEIHNRGQLKKHMRDCMIYLGYYLVFFFIYLYCLIISLLQGDPLPRHDELMEF